LTWDTVPDACQPRRHGPPGSEDAQVAVDQGVQTSPGPVVVDQKTGDVYITSPFERGGHVLTGVPPFGDPSRSSSASRMTTPPRSTHLVKRGSVGAIAGAIFPDHDRQGRKRLRLVGRFATRRAPATRRLPRLPRPTTATVGARPTAFNQDVGNAHIYSTISAGERRHGRRGLYQRDDARSRPAPTTTGTSTSRRSENAKHRQAGDQAIASIPEQHSPRRCLPARILCVAGGDRSLLRLLPASRSAGWKTHTSAFAKQRLAGRSTADLGTQARSAAAGPETACRTPTWCARSGG